jgi:hypothetical protein
MLDAKAPPAARIGAAMALLDRACGRPTQQEVRITALDVTRWLDLRRLSHDQLNEFERLLELTTEGGSATAP